MADPSTWKPGNAGDLQPWRSLRGSSDLPAKRICETFTEWVGNGDYRMAANTDARSYGFSSDTCIMCGYPESRH